MKEHFKYLATGFAIVGMAGTVLGMIALMLEYFPVTIVLISLMVGIYAIGKYYHGKD